MSLFEKWIYGVDPAEEQRRQDALEAALAAENEKDRARYGDKWFEEAQGNLEKSKIDERAEVDQAFDEGLQEGADNVTAVISKPFEIAGTAVGSVLKAFPWWLWVAGLAVAGFYFWPVLRPLLAKRR